MSDKLYTVEEFLTMTANIENYQECINGHVFDIESFSLKQHKIRSGICTTIRKYIAHHSSESGMLSFCGVIFNQTTLALPAVWVVCDSSRLSPEEEYLTSAPDWIIEILSEDNPKSRQHNLIAKQALYKNNHVREYWIVDPKNEKTLVYFFEKNDLPDIYTFDTAVPVEIYDRKLSINISELLKGNLT